MKRIATCLLLATVLVAGAASARVRNVTDPDAPRSLPAEGAVQVQWQDPAGFTDLRMSGNLWQARRGNWVYQLAEHLRDAAGARLADGRRLDVTLLDIERAGRYEPWNGVRMQDVRVLRDIYPPTIELAFVLRDDAGNVLAEGNRRLRDMHYLSYANFGSTSDPLRHEKRLIDRWLRDELAAAPLARR